MGGPATIDARPVMGYVLYVSRSRHPSSRNSYVGPGPNTSASYYAKHYRRPMAQPLGLQLEETTVIYPVHGFAGCVVHNKLANGRQTFRVVLVEGSLRKCFESFLYQLIPSIHILKIVRKDSRRY